MNRLLPIFEMLLRVGVILVPAGCFAGVFLMTVGTDEAWILFGVRGLIEHGQYSAGSPYNSVLSTGGLYTALVALLHLIGDGRIEVIRLLSVVSVAALLFTLHLWALRFNIKSPYRWLVTASPLLVPGTMMFGAQAYGEILAFLLVIVGLMMWGELQPETWRRRLLIGLLIGTAVAIRQNVVFALIAPMLVVILTRGNRKYLINSLIVLIIGSSVFLFQYLILRSLSANLLSDVTANYFAFSAFTSQFGYFIPIRLSYWSIGQSFLPFALAVLISIGWSRARLIVSKPHGVDALLVFAWLAMLAWLFFAPIPHLRYMWPALAAFASVGMFAISLLMQAHARHTGSALLLGFALLATGYLDGARSFKHGESDILSWELSRETYYTTEYGPLRYIQFQRAIVSRLLQIPPDEPIATISFDTALSFLTHRTVVPVQTYYSGARKRETVFWSPAQAETPVRPRWIVLTPMVNHYRNAYLSPQLYDWIKVNCRVADRQGPYVLYEVVGEFPEKPDIFSLEQWAQSPP